MIPTYKHFILTSKEILLLCIFSREIRALLDDPNHLVIYFLIKINCFQIYSQFNTRLSNWRWWVGRGWVSRGSLVVSRGSGIPHVYTPCIHTFMLFGLIVPKMLR